MAIYESIIIMDSLMPPKDIEASIERFSGIVTGNDGSIRKVEKWGKKRLAFEIQKKQYGFYVSIEFEGLGNIPRLLESEYNYNDKVIRYLTYSYDKHKLKALEAEEKEMEKTSAPEPAPEPVKKEVVEEVKTAEAEPVSEEAKEETQKTE